MRSTVSGIDLANMCTVSTRSSMAILLVVNGDDVNDDCNDTIAAMMHMTMVVWVMPMRMCLTRPRGGVGHRMSTGYVKLPIMRVSPFHPTHLPAERERERVNTM